MRARIHPSPHRGGSRAVSVTVDPDAHWRRAKLSITNAHFQGETPQYVHTMYFP